jgi:hypothetical protein
VRLLQTHVRLCLPAAARIRFEIVPYEISVARGIAVRPVSELFCGNTHTTPPGEWPLPIANHVPATSSMCPPIVISIGGIGFRPNVQTAFQNSGPIRCHLLQIIVQAGIHPEQFASLRGTSPSRGLPVSHRGLIPTVESLPASRRSHNQRIAVLARGDGRARRISLHMNLPAEFGGGLSG